MRLPTPLDVQLRWWRANLNGGDITSEFPECGYFKTRKEPRSKTWLPARIYLHQDIDWETGLLTAPETFVLEIVDRQWTDPDQVAQRWLFLKPVPMEQWRWLRARLALQNGLQVTASISD
jgi:hypothetical protein